MWPFFTAFQKTYITSKTSKATRTHTHTHTHVKNCLITALREIQHHWHARLGVLGEHATLLKRHAPLKELLVAGHAAGEVVI